jgi:hypothetical protein
MGKRSKSEKEENEGLKNLGCSVIKQLKGRRQKFLHTKC